jgi:hypothetical protein
MSSIFNLRSSDFDVFVSSEKDFQIDVFALSDKNCGLFSIETLISVTIFTHGWTSSTS